MQAGDNQRTVAYAVLAGSALIAGAVYFGLRSRAPVALSPNAVAPSAVGTPQSTNAHAAANVDANAPATLSSGGARPLEVATANAPKAIDRAASQSAIERALDAQKAMFRDRCWNDSAKRTPTPAQSTYVFEISVDADGKEIARGISDGENARADVGQCLRMLIAPISIAPPQQRLTTRVRITLP